VRRPTLTRRRALVHSLGWLVFATACSRGEDSIALHGAGATLPYPLYSKWAAEYHRLNPNVTINYQSIGSGGGVRQLIARTVDFGASDVPVLETEARGLPPGALVHVPTAIGSVVVSYRLSGLQAPLKLTPEALAGIFLGDIQRWNAVELAAANPGVSLPDLPIAVVHRSDGSGTTAIFSEFLARASPAFRERAGSGKNVRWPIGTGAKGNEGVTGQLQSREGAIGYTELAYATQNRLPRAELRNRAGRFVAPSPEAATAAAEGVELPASLHGSLADAQSEHAYPLAAYTYLLVYKDALDPKKGEALARFLWWALHDGQRFTHSLDYAPLPARVVSQAEAALQELRANGLPLLAAERTAAQTR
jgi:phosphate transport system substrate-binding protein